MGEDFVNVRLTEFGASLAPVVVHAGGTPAPDGHGARHREFIFKPGDVLRVTRSFEWERILAHERIDGKPLFEIAPEAKPAKKATQETAPPAA